MRASVPPGPAEIVRLVLTGPLSSGAEYDMSFEATIPVERFQINLEETEAGRFSYVADESADGWALLTDAGMNPPMNDVVTHGFAAEQLPPRTRISARFIEGHKIHSRVWTTVAILGLTALGAILLAVSLSFLKTVRGTFAFDTNRVMVDDILSSIFHCAIAVCSRFL